MIRLAHPGVSEIERIVWFIHSDKLSENIPVNFLRKYYLDLAKSKQVIIYRENGGIIGVIDWWIITEDLLRWIKNTSPEEFAITTVKGIYPKHVPGGTVAYISFFLVDKDHRNRETMWEMIDFTKKHLNGIKRVAWHNHRKKSIETFKLRREV